MSAPWLSVVMPTYNGEAYLPFALKSILDQRERGNGDADIEVIAVDDGSTDTTLEVLESFTDRLPLTIVRRGHGGNWVENANYGLEVARATHACLLHQDDVWLEARLATLKRVLADAPDTTLVLHPSWFIDPKGRRVGLWRCPLPPGRVEPGLLVERLLVQNFISVPAPVFRREAASRAGGMDEELWYTADWDLWLKLAVSGETVYVPRALAGFRVHPLSQTIVRSRRGDDVRRQMEMVIERHLPAWEAAHPGRPVVRRAARFAVDLNACLLAGAGCDRPGWARLAWRFLKLGPGGWYRFLRDSRIVERVAARGRSGLGSPGRGADVAISR